VRKLIPLHIGIYIFDQAEVLDFSGPFEVFTTASRASGNEQLFDVSLIGETGETVSARAGFKVIPDFGFHNHPEIDVLIIVGGMHLDEMNKPRVLEWISRQAKQAAVVASVCTGAFLLAKAGILRTQRVTTHWDDIAELRQQFPGLDVVEGVRWVEEDGLLTSGGISAGIDMSLYLVSKLEGIALAEKTAKQMEFSWTKG